MTGSLDASLAEVEKNWNEFGKRDPLWAILTDESKRNGKWDPVEFFARGEREIDGVLKYVEGLKHTFGKGKALDFGCGVGRLTQALCRHFEECHGVDIAESMVEQARQYNRYGERCHYHVNKKPDLAIFATDTFDFIYTNIVLQHNPPDVARKFISEFLRILKPGGMLVFQLPSEQLQALNGQRRPMKDCAFRAALGLKDPVPQMTAGTSHRIEVTVKNTSLEVWPGKETSGKLAVRLGNHWRDTKGCMIVQDDARADLAEDLKPNGEVTLAMMVTVPGATGRFQLELDMVQEHVAWFANKSSKTLIAEIDIVAAPSKSEETVRAAANRRAVEAAKELHDWFDKQDSKTSSPKTAETKDLKPGVITPRMDMNGIPKPLVEAFLKSIGGKLLNAIDDGAANGWVSYRYHVVKETAPIRAARATNPNQKTANYTEETLASMKGRIAVIGNATPRHNFGELIDGYDTVIRLNNFCIKGFEQLVGGKTDYRCTTAWHDIEHRNEHVEFSPFTAAAEESGNLRAFNAANTRAVLPACMDIHPLIAETQKPSAGFALIQLCSYLEIPVDLFAFDGFKTAHYWDKNQGTYTTHSRNELEFILKRANLLLYGETYPYQELYDFCHKNHGDYNVNVGLQLALRLKKEFHGLKALEFGSGNGDLARHLEEQGNQVTAVEASLEAIQRIACTRKVHGTALALPFIKEPHDLFVSVDVLEHLTENDVKLVIREAARLCRRIFVSVCTRPSGLLGPNGENLHLTVRPPCWWAKQFGRFFKLETYQGYGSGQLVIEGERLTDVNLPLEISSDTNDEFYVNLFIKDPVWSTPHPNEDEAARWGKISGLIRHVANRHASGNKLRILDVGCGRGWLTQMASEFGESEGVEPVAPVVEQARKLFPNRRFTVGTAETILKRTDFEPYDLVLTSEVIEHVPQAKQPAFAHALSRLLKPGGHAIVTTPRGEALQEWTKLQGDPSQPVEEWLNEAQLRDLFVSQNFSVAGQERVLIDKATRRYSSLSAPEANNPLLPIYQVWAFQKPLAEPAVGNEAAKRLFQTAAKLPGYSFCIITNGKRPQKLAEEIASIRALNFPNFEILVGGDAPPGLEGVKIVPAVDAAKGGRLGEMRNRLTEKAQYDHLVVADDDLFFSPDFYEGLQKFGEDYETLCVRFLNVDGSRYWDWATHGGPRGHQLLDYDENDPFVYVTGGLCIMKADVAARVQWNEGCGFYQGEDLDFSGRLRRAGISIKFNRHSSVIHTDARYTQFGKVIMTAETLRQSTLAKLDELKWDAAKSYFDKLREFDPGAAEALAKEAPILERTQTNLPVRWRGPIFNPSGYASEAINFILPLSQRVAMGIFHQNNNYSKQFVDGLKPNERTRLFSLRDNYSKIFGGIVIDHNPANGFCQAPDAAYHIGRTMFETDRISPEWVRACNQMDEVWVPSRFNVETFANSGVERRKLRVMPEAVDEAEFDPAKHDALPLPNRAGCNFLSIFEWSRRKGWDVLLAAYLREFSASDDVCLYVRTYLFGKPDGDPRIEIQRRINDYVATLNLGDKKLPRIEVLAEQVAQADLPRLYKAADCLVAPARGEGWGRPHHEAMLMGLPVIATNWSGNTEFMTQENSFLVDYTLAATSDLEPELRHYRGHGWANPSEGSLREALRRVFANRDEARARGQRARQEMLAKYSRVAVANLVVKRLLEIEKELSTSSCVAIAVRENNVPQAPGNAARRVRVNWEGTFLDFGSLSHVNRELTEALARNRNVEATRVGPQNDNAPQELKKLARRVQTQGAKDADVTLRHAWPPNWEKPAAGAWVLIQPWEFGVLPANWVKGMADVDEVWAPSEYVRRVYVDSGINPEKVKIVPNGIDPEKFRPGLEAWPLATQKKFKFLFVGGTIRRKGPDILLKAYLETFTSADDVCLVIKDFGGQSVYQGQTLEQEIAAARQNPNAPEILYLTEELPAEAMPRLYAACDCLAHPYRGEGFGLPVLEAMACGLPVIVTGGGATDDFAADDFAYRLPALRTSIGDKVGNFKLSRNGWWLEPEVNVLKERLRWVTTHREEAQALGIKASEYVRREWTWKRAAEIAEARLQNLVARKKAEKEALAERRNRKPGPVELPASALLGNLTAATELFKRKEYGAAWKVTLESLETRPYHPEAYLLLAEIARAMGNGVVSQQMARRAKELAPEWNPPKQFLKSAKPTANARVTPSDLGLAEAINDFDRDATRTPRLTVCMIVKNEEQFIAQCLKSIKDIAWQIVVVDTGSTDRTVAIAKEHGAEIYQFKWDDDFSAARNAALERARGDWVLSLDADEELLPEHKETLQKEMKAAEAMAYRLPIIDKGREQEGCSYVPRLFRNAPGLFFLGRVHEQAFSSIEVRCQQWGLKHVMGKTALFHHGYTPELMKDRNKIERNLKLLELAIEEMPNDPNLLMNYGLELVRSGQSLEGLNYYIEALRCASELPVAQVTPELRETLLTQLTTHLLQGKLFDQIIKIWQTPFAKASDQTASQHFTLGLAYMELKQPARAAEQMRLCLAKREQPSFSPRNPEVMKAGPAHCLAICLTHLQEPAPAMEYFKAAIAIEPKARAPRLDFAKFLAESGKQLDALKWLNQLLGENQTDLEVWRTGGQIALSKPEFRNFACDWTGEAIKHFPQEPLIILQRAEALFLAEKAPQALTFWKDARLPKQARSDAARILCEILLGRMPAEIAPCDERAVSQEALKWYRRLIAIGAVASVHALNDKIETIRATLPSFVAVWETATRKASAAAAPTPATA